MATFRLPTIFVLLFSCAGCMGAKRLAKPLAFSYDKAVESFVAESERATPARSKLAFQTVGYAVPKDAHGLSSLPIAGSPHSTRTPVLSLEEAERLALQNSTVIRKQATFYQATGGNSATRFDPAVVDTGFLFGQRGVQAALSDFDPRVTRRFFVNQNELIQNNRFLSGGILPGGTLRSRGGTYETILSKANHQGGELSLIHRWDYDASNRQDLLYTSVLTGTLRAEYRQPLMAGRGRAFTDVAGPIGDSIDGVTGVSQGILIAKSTARKAQLELTQEVAVLLRDVQQLHARLVQARRKLELMSTAYRELAEIRDRIVNSVQEGAAGSALDVAEVEGTLASLQLDISSAQKEQAGLEIEFARLIGVEAALADNGMMGVQLLVDEANSQQIALQSRPEIAIQRLDIQSMNLQQAAARKLLQPRLDVVAGTWINGFGDRLLGESVPGPDRDTQIAFENLFQNDHEGWSLGIEYQRTLGRRFADTRLENLSLQLRRQRVLLAELEREIELEVQYAISQLEQTWNQLLAARRAAESTQRVVLLIENQQDHDWQASTLPRMVSAKYNHLGRRIAILDIEAEYEVLKAEFAYRQGTVLAESSVSIAPGSK